MLPGLSPQEDGKPVLRIPSTQSIKNKSHASGHSKSKMPRRDPSTQSIKDNTKANGHTNPRPQFRSRNNERRCPHAQQKPAAPCGMHQRSLRLRALLPDHSRCGAVRYGGAGMPGAYRHPVQAYGLSPLHLSGFHPPSGGVPGGLGGAGV